VLKNASLALKLNILVLLVLVLLLIGIVFLLIRNTQNLTQEIGGERIHEEVNIIESRLAEFEREMQVDTDFVVSSVSFYQAVGLRSETQTGNIINTANATLGLDDITVIDGDGKRLVDTQPDSDNTQENALLMRALRGQTLTALLIENNTGNTEISLAAAAPVLSGSGGNILGAIQMSRHISPEFLQSLLFGQDAVYLGVVYQNRIVARSTPVHANYLDTVLVNDIAVDNTAVQSAHSGEVVILPNLVLGEGNVPHTVAYVPVLIDNGSTEVVIMIVVELHEIFMFQNSTLFNTITVFFALTLFAMAIIYINIYRTMIRPLEKLRTISQTITKGRYDERVPVNTNDEVGQLGSAFNEMAVAVQLREVSLQAAREQAERADRVKSMFLASVSHELRTPLNAIINLSKFVGLGMYGEVNPEQADILRKVEARSKHLLNLINDVLDISKIETGSLELFVENDVRVDTITLAAIETAQTLIMDKPIEIRHDIDADLPSLTGDAQRIHQIILNLLSNACRFTEEGFIEVRVYRQGTEIIIAIADSGPGIAPENHELIFEAFRQTKEGLRKGEGTGLGLPISRRLAEAHRGRVWVDSTLGQGATFSVALPLETHLVATIV
jgi:signal transduction histidine kinase